MENCSQICNKAITESVGEHLTSTGDTDTKLDRRAKVDGSDSTDQNGVIAGRAELDAKADIQAKEQKSERLKRKMKAHAQVARAYQEKYLQNGDLRVLCGYNVQRRFVKQTAANLEKMEITVTLKSAKGRHLNPLRIVSPKQSQLFKRKLQRQLSIRK